MQGIVKHLAGNVRQKLLFYMVIERTVLVPGLLLAMVEFASVSDASLEMLTDNLLYESVDLDGQFDDRLVCVLAQVTVTLY